MNTVTFLQDKIRNARALDFGTIFSDSIELFKKTWLQGFLLKVFEVIIMLPLIIILYVPMIMLFISQSQSGGYDSDEFSALFAGFSVLYIILIVVGVIVLSSVSVALQAAFFRIMRALDEGKAISTSDFFYFLKGKYLSKTFMLVVVTVLISIPAALACYIPLIYVMVPLSFFAIIFAFNPELSVGDIVKLSFNLGNKKWGITFGLLIVSGLILFILGGITCGLASLFIAAFTYHPVYFIYKNVIGFDTDSEINRIGDAIE